MNPYGPIIFIDEIHTTQNPHKLFNIVFNIDTDVVCDK